jgi:hypothetical protein
MLAEAVGQHLEETDDLGWKKDLFPAKCITQTDFLKDVAVMANSGAESSFAGSLRSKRQPPNDLT